MLKITNLAVNHTAGKILENLDLEIKSGSVTVLMGPNGSGKSTLSKVLMGHPDYSVVSGNVTFLGNDLLNLSPDKRAQLGLFVAMQYPTEVPGVNFRNFLRLAYNSSKAKEEQLPVFKFRQLLLEKAKLLDIDEKFFDRNLNEGLSGGEKKKMEMLQLAVLQPKLAILDETDSGLDVDALKVVFEGVAKIKAENPAMAILVITHYHKIFDYITPETVHIIKAGRIIKSGGAELLQDIEKNGYQNY